MTLNPNRFIYLTFYKGYVVQRTQSVVFLCKIVWKFCTQAFNRNTGKQLVLVLNEIKVT